MSAVLRELEPTERLLYAWGDECRSASERLGLPVSSSLSRLLEQQSVFEQRARARRGRSRKAVAHKLPDGTRASLCVCGCIFVEELCPRCKNDPRPAEAQVHGTETRSFKKPAMTALNGSTAILDVIVARAPGWMQQRLMLSYLWLMRDNKACQRVRVRQAVYTEQRLAAVEYVSVQLAYRHAGAL